ncbi:MAG: inositol monophosphatase [Magnetovibrio sp.]|nr:inositol monophosphatase [Magnetovibrio sp.]
MIADPHAVAEALRAVARDEILPRFGNLKSHEITEKNRGEVVTVADEAAEAALTEALGPLLPGAGVVGEEGAAKAPESLDALAGPAPVWIIDPVDGTQNFADGDDCFAVIVALAVDGVTEAGWIHEPIADTTVWARRGAGAWENGRRLTIGDGVAFAEFKGSLNPRFRRRLEDARRRDAASLPTDICRYGCVGAEYADLARGKLQFARYAGRLKPWDHAAGVLIHAEAGGHHGIVETDAAYAPAAALPQQTLLLAPRPADWQRLSDLLST